jgi:hypothetical protein
MENISNQLKTVFEDFLKEDEKFTSGNAAAGTRARKALAEMGKLIKARRNEITAEKNARKAEKDATKSAPVKGSKK